MTTLGEEVLECSLSKITSQNYARSNALDEYALKICLDIQIGPLSVENEDFKIASINDTRFIPIKKKRNYIVTSLNSVQILYVFICISVWGGRGASVSLRIAWDRQQDIPWRVWSAPDTPRHNQTAR